LQDAAAGVGQGQAGPDWQAAQQQPLGYAGEWWGLSAKRWLVCDVMYCCKVAALLQSVQRRVVQH
jgi:hypothetical protein